MAPPRLAVLSVDLDEVACYCAIHGLEMPPGDVQHAIYEHALPRFAELFAELGVPATFFVVGADLQRPANGAAIARLHDTGHEIGNHSQHHRYDLSRQPAATMHAEIADADAAIAAVTGERPVGFRAPGYTVSDRLLAEVAALGYQYDSSVFPCPAYYAAKLSLIAALQLRRRPSRSLVDDPRVLRAPAEPYRIAQPYWRRGEGLLELPIGVTSLASGRLPYIGTSLLLAGRQGARWLTRAIVGRPLVNLELHGIDLADATRDGLAFLLPHQPDLRRPLEEKLAILRTVVEQLAAAGYRFVRLDDVADDASTRCRIAARASSSARSFSA